MKREVKEMLGRLYPGDNVNQIYGNLQKRKKRTVFLIILIGIAALICVHTSSRMHSKLQEGPCLYRNEWGEGSYEVTLSAVTDSGEQTIHYKVEEREFTDKELEELYQRAEEELKVLILGKNESLSFVTDNLYLPRALEKYPFIITWSSSNTEILHTDGKVFTEKIIKEGEAVTLTALFQCQDYVQKREYEVRVFHEVLSAEEQQKENINALLAQIAENTSRRSIIMLPDQVGGEKITWREEKSNDSIWALFMAIVGAAAAVYSIDREIYKRDKQREKQLQEDYPEFVTMLQFYMAAGLSVRNIFFKIADDYQKEKKKTGKMNFLSEEIVIACHLFSNAQTEENVYRNWADRCNEQHYRKLGSLLISYGRQGNDNMIQMLSDEVYQAWKEQKNRIKRKGEEAGTKLLLPMMLMLLVVMLLILLPVYTGL